MSEPITIVKSYLSGYLSLRLKMRVVGWGGGVVAINASTDLTPTQARDLASNLLKHADAVDARMAAEEARQQRRKAWREREVAAGRLVVMGGPR